MSLVSPDGGFLRVNRALCDMLGYDEDALLQLDFQALTHPDDLGTDLEQLRRALAGEIRTYRLEKRYLRRDGEVVWATLSVSLVSDPAGRPQYFVSQIEDISERKRAEETLRDLADRDSLTGLLNRRRFNEELERELARVRRHGGQAAVLVIDLDRFKLVNDTLGHRAGDDVLCAVARTLVTRLRSTDVIARTGGDEFAVIALEAGDRDGVRRLAHDVAEAIRTQIIATCGTTVRLTASIGVALVDDHTSASPDLLLVAADDAMYRAKRSGRDRVATAA
jgi:diguanylate cyclase (GGDEF)-like protein/PAS domain S-box-containing protein